VTSPKPDTREFLLQLDISEELLPKIGKEQWQTLYSSSDAAAQQFTMWCALLSESEATRAMGHDTWDLTIGDGGPGFTRSFSKGTTITTYDRFGGRDGVRPLVLYRSFSGAFPDYLEIDEEFRLYHDLAEDRTRGLLLSFDESGREIEVVRIRPKEVQARLRYLRQFQAGTGLHLAIFIDSIRYSRIPLADVAVDERERVESAGPVRWRRNVLTCDFKQEYKTFSRVLSKVILSPPPQDKGGIWPFKDIDGDRTVAFIVGVDDEGNEVEHSSEPGTLSNNFGANPREPHYLTPIYFRREVLAKYFGEPERYRVDDGLLRCLSLWCCRIDNDLASHVMVYLGDLGQDLPYEERLHWRQYNVPPEGGGSGTNLRRSMLAEFTDSESPDLAFRRSYRDLSNAWTTKHGWPLFLPSAPGDAHLLDTVRIPVTSGQGEFDEQIGHLAKLLVDSLNEKALADRGLGVEEGVKGIGKLVRFLEATQFPQRDAVERFLRDLQALRSAGSAHRKGSGYKKIIAKLGVDAARKPDAVRRLLEQGTSALRALRAHYIEGPGGAG
jgi:hypothetical protein